MRTFTVRAYKPLYPNLPKLPAFRGLDVSALPLKTKIWTLGGHPWEENGQSVRGLVDSVGTECIQAASRDFYLVQMPAQEIPSAGCIDA